MEVLHQDAELSATYEDPGGAPVGCPLHVWGGDADELVTAELLDGWRTYAGGTFHRRQFVGAHDFCTGRAEIALPALRDVVLQS